LCYRLRRELRQRRRNSERAHHQKHDVLHVHVQSEYPSYTQYYVTNIIVLYNIFLSSIFLTILNILIMHYTYCGQIDNSIYDIILKYIMALGVGRTKNPENKSNGKKSAGI